MRRVPASLLCVLLLTSACLAIPVTLFVDTATFAERAKDIVIARCDRVRGDVDLGDGLRPVEVTVTGVLKGEMPRGAAKVATIYPMRAGGTYALTSLGGSVADITFLALPELSVVELPDGFDVSDLEGLALEEQLEAVFAASKGEIERQRESLKRGADLLAKALEKGLGPEAPAPRYELWTLHAELGGVVRRHFPGARSHVLGEKVYFERDTRVFLVHPRPKTGEWEDAVEERGPTLNGVIVEVTIAPGPYGGAAMARQSFDGPYFTRFFMAPYSEKLDAHLHVVVKHTPRVPPAFLKELTAVLDRFEEYVRQVEK